MVCHGGMNGERKYQKKWWHYKIKAKKYYNRDKGASVLICGVLLSWKIQNKLIGKINKYNVKDTFRYIF